MPKQEEKQLVAYTKDQMFDLVSNIDEYKEFLPWCNDSKIISRERFDDYEVVTADLEIGYDQFVYTYRSEVKLAKDKSNLPKYSTQYMAQNKNYFLLNDTSLHGLWTYKL